MSASGTTRRSVLRGAGVALALPWLESLAPRAARAQAAPPRRFVAMYFPCGVAQTFWKPKTPGAGAAWDLSPILEPLASVKSQVSVLANVGNYGPFGGHVEPSYANLAVAFLTCTRAGRVGSATGARCGTSVDQVIAKGLAGRTKIPSLQVGLATTTSNSDGLPFACARSVSWASPFEPLGRIVDPQAVFDRLVGTDVVAAGPGGGVDPFAAARRFANKSVLDAVLGHAASVRTRLGRSDHVQLDGYLASVRDLETRAADGSLALACAIGARPPQSIGVEKTPPGYDRGVHADLMIDLVAMALRCDLTRVVSFMFDDAGSDYAYDFLPRRTFTDTTSMPGTGTVGSPHLGVNTSNSDFGYATLSRWYVEKLSRLCGRLAAVAEGTGTVLDNSVVWFGSEMHGTNQDALDLPTVYVGSGGGRLKVNQYIDFATTTRATERLANVYLTFIRNVFDLPDISFGGTGNNGTILVPTPGTAFGAGTEIVPELLA
jgi:hypothetical protein